VSLALAILITVVAAISIGAAPTAAANSTNDSAATFVTIELSGPPTALYGYAADVESANGFVLSDKSHLISRDYMYVKSGGNESEHIEIRASDIGYEANSSTSETVLFQVVFDGHIPDSEISTSNVIVIDENYSDISERVVTDIEHKNLFNSPVNSSDQSDSVPADLDNDNLYEDINGDGIVDFEDVNDFSAGYDDVDGPAKRASLDFDGDGDLDYSDVIEYSFDYV
jgi:hypothetical protein